MGHSKNFQRYLDWYKRGSISKEQLEKLRDEGLITPVECEEIIATKPII